MTGGGGCRTCFRIRLFIVAAWPLLVLIYLRPESAQRVAALMPGARAIGTGLVVASVILFTIRFYQMKTERPLRV